MLPKTKKMGKKQKGTTTLSKRAHTKSVRESTVSVVTPPYLDESEQNFDSDLRGDTDLDLASHIDMIMSIIVDLSSTVNGQEEVSQLQSVTAHFPQDITWG